MGYDSPKPSLVPVGESEVAHISRNPLVGLTPASPVHDQQAEIEHRFISHETDEGEYDEEFEQEEEFVASSFASLADSYEAEHEEVETGTDDEVETLELSTEIADDEGVMLDLSSEIADDADAVRDEMPAAIVVDAHAPLVPFASAFERPSVEPEAVRQPESEPELGRTPEPAFVPKPVAATKPASRPMPRPEALAKGKAAFTLRLDPSRHLKLRLACAVTAKSAQQLVTRALDELLASMPELEAMAERAPAERVSRKG
ncbi:MAG TPA: hypothetical protein VM913_05160 [Sphingomicrobium sp.]|nr:hypothetical protein [Sphingomicrobium sp.]